MAHFLQKTVASLKAANPDWTRDFTKRYFSPVVVWAFNTLLPGSFKANLCTSDTDSRCKYKE